MICVGFDVSKNKSTVCIARSSDKQLEKPFDVLHTTDALEALAERLRSFSEPIRLVMEATGHYHLPVAFFFSQHGFFVSVENPMVIKRYESFSLHGGKTDPLDSIKIALYGLKQWDNLRKFQASQDTYCELKLLLNQYLTYMKMFVHAKQNLIFLMDQTLPGFKKALDSKSASDFQRIKYKDFAEKYWHVDCICKMGKKRFIESYQNWCKKKGYQFSQKKADELFQLAETGIPSQPSDMPSAKLAVQLAAKQVTTNGAVLNDILAQMQTLAKTLPEYQVVREMSGIGEKLCPSLIAAIGDPRRFYSAKSLVAYSGVDAPPYQSGKFYGNKRKICKRGSSRIRKICYEVIQSLKSHPPKEDVAVYEFVKKKEAEGKAKKVANIAGVNKLLHIYYARVMEVYKNLKNQEDYQEKQCA